ncbi:hypothetical protein AMK59_8191 [Oryctes borbonicus]|uniref:Uncharacterized protein n=1 Tax=Oryctes borbonicus TaxID=1629725 RepID=A0A0T6AX50_9SCAR|nr:hypothetical protein AMK59_8191 [Oryctes borbonicus]
MHLGGSAAINMDTILKTSHSAARRANIVIEEIKKCVEQDNMKRLNKEEVGLHLRISKETDSHEIIAAHEKLSSCLDKWNKVKKKKKKIPKEIHELCGSIESLGKNSAVLLPEETDGNKWIASSDEEIDIIPEEAGNHKHKGNVKLEGDDSEEEEEVLMLNTTETEQVKKKQKIKKDDQRNREHFLKGVN